MVSHSTQTISTSVKQVKQGKISRGRIVDLRHIKTKTQGRLIDLRHIKAKTQGRIVDLRHIKGEVEKVVQILNETEQILNETEELLTGTEAVKAEEVIEENERVLEETAHLIQQEEVEEKPVARQPFPQFYPFYTYHTDDRYYFGGIQAINVGLTSIRAKGMLRHATTQEQIDHIKTGYKNACEYIYRWCKKCATHEVLSGFILWYTIAVAKRIGLDVHFRYGDYKEDVINRFIRMAQAFVREYEEIMQ